MAQLETWIRERAYALWEIEGRPEGRERQHWEQATRDVISRGRGAAVGPAALQPAEMSTRSTRKAPTGKRSGRTRRAA